MLHIRDSSELVGAELSLGLHYDVFDAVLYADFRDEIFRKGSGYVLNIPSVWLVTFQLC